MVTKQISAAPFAMLAIFIGAIIPIMFAIAIFEDGFWTFDVNTLSDLGVSYDDTAAKIFNYTCIIGGILAAIVGLGKMFVKSGLDSASAFFLALGGVFLVGIGLFTEDYSIHNYLAYLFFALITISLIISMVADSRNGRMIIAAISAIVFVIMLASFPGFTSAGVEVICVVCMCVWLIAQGVSLAFSKN